MRCDQLQRHIDELLDRREDLRSDGPLQAHLAACPACLRLAHAYEAMILGVEVLGEVEPAPLLVRQGSVAASGWVEPNTLRRATFPHYLPAMIVAASLLLMAVISWRMLEKGPSSGVVATPKDQADSASFSSAFLDQLAVTLALKQVCHTTGQEIAVLPYTVRRVASLPETDRIVSHVRPFTDPFGATWQVLLRAWPGTTTPTSAVSDGPETDTSQIHWQMSRRIV
jgi:hypothetical protein